MMALLLDPLGKLCRIRNAGMLLAIKTLNPCDIPPTDLMAETPIQLSTPQGPFLSQKTLLLHSNSKPSDVAQCEAMRVL